MNKKIFMRLVSIILLLSVLMSAFSVFATKKEDKVSLLRSKVTVVLGKHLSRKMTPENLIIFSNEVGAIIKYITLYEMDENGERTGDALIKVVPKKGSTYNIMNLGDSDSIKYDTPYCIEVKVGNDTGVIYDFICREALK